MNSVILIPVILLVVVVFLIILFRATMKKSKNAGGRSNSNGSDIIQCPRCSAYVPASGGRPCRDEGCPLRRYKS